MHQVDNPGKLRLWGRVVEHTRGYRGQHAQPLKLTYVGDGPEAEETAAELAAFYGCPCTLQAPAVPNPYPLGLDPTMLLGGGSVRVRGGVTAASGVYQLPSMAHLVQAQTAANASIARVLTTAALAAPYDQGSRRAWPVRFARWTSYSSNGLLGFACYMALVFATGVPASLFVGPLGMLLALPWVAFWGYANLSGE